MTQERLAASVNVTTETISRLERGVTMPSLLTLGKISNALHTSFKDRLDFEYPKSKGDSFEDEMNKLIAFLKTRDADDIRMCYQMLHIIFEHIEKKLSPCRFHDSRNKRDTGAVSLRVNVKATTGEGTYSTFNEVQSCHRRGVLQYAPTPGFFFVVLRLGVLVSQTIGELIPFFIPQLHSQFLRLHFPHKIRYNRNLFVSCLLN